MLTYVFITAAAVGINLKKKSKDNFRIPAEKKPAHFGAPILEKVVNTPTL